MAHEIKGGTWEPDTGDIYTVDVTYRLIDGSDLHMERRVIVWCVLDSERWIVTYSDEENKPSSEPFILLATERWQGTFLLGSLILDQTRKYVANDPHLNSTAIMSDQYTKRVDAVARWDADQKPADYDHSAMKLGWVLEQAERLTAIRDNAIRNTLAARDPEKRDGTVDLIMRKTGLSRARIYQIRDAK